MSLSSWKLKTLNYNARFIQLAGEINSGMPRYWVAKALRQALRLAQDSALRLAQDAVVDALNEAGKPLKGSNVLVLKDASQCWA